MPVQDEAISETLNIHVALKHIKHRLYFLGKQGLGVWSEQARDQSTEKFLIFGDDTKLT